MLSQFEANSGENEINIMVYEGFLKVETTGEYEISYNTNGGLVMHIHEALIIDNDNPNIATGSGTSKVVLEKGYHPVKLAPKELITVKHLSWSLK